MAVGRHEVPEYFLVRNRVADEVGVEDAGLLARFVSVQPIAERGISMPMKLE
jgi:hypothetical protein